VNIKIWLDELTITAHEQLQQNNEGKRNLSSFSLIQQCACSDNTRTGKRVDGVLL